MLARHREGGMGQNDARRVGWRRVSDSELLLSHCARPSAKREGSGPAGEKSRALAVGPSSQDRLKTAKNPGGTEKDNYYNRYKKYSWTYSYYKMLTREQNSENKNKKNRNRNS